MLAYADAFYVNPTHWVDAPLAKARARVIDGLGSAALVDAAGIIGMFDAVVRVADATGIPLEDVKADVSRNFRMTLGIDEFHPDKRQ